MKIIAFIISLACLGQAVLADDEATPSPTPVYINPLARRGAIRRAEQIDRRRTLQADAESHAQARAQAQANRRSSATARGESRDAARARERAQHEVAAQNRLETARATPRAASDLMSRMGFSEQEIAAQKAREQSTNGAPAPSATPANTNNPTPKPTSTPASAHPDSH